MVKAVLFDLDGVVFDTENQYTEFWGEEGRRYFPDIPDFALRIKGQTLVQIYDRFFEGKDNEQQLITQRLNEFETKMHFDYVPGFVDFVTDLRTKGIKTAIVTSSNIDKMNNVYRSHPELKSLVDKVFTSENFTRSKPHPECYLMAAAHFGYTSSECVGFEDSFNGLKAVRAADMKVVGLATTNAVEDIEPYCDIVIKDYKNWTHKIPLFT